MFFTVAFFSVSTTESDESFDCAVTLSAGADCFSTSSASTVTDILSDSKCEEITQKFREQWNQPTI